MKKLVIIGLAVCLALACWGPLLRPTLADEGNGGLTNLKFATLAPKGLGYAVQVESLFMPWFAEATEGKVSVRVYWGGVMGNDNEYLQKMRIGQIHGAGLAQLGMNDACPEMLVLGLPFLFRDYDEVDFVREAMFDTFDHYFSQSGFKLLLWLDQGFDQLYSAKIPLRRLDDFTGSRIPMHGPIEIMTVEALGATPLLIEPSEVPASFRMGMLNTVLAPAIFIVGTQMYTNVHYVNDLKLRYSPGGIVLANKAWEGLSEKYHQNLNQGRSAITASFVQGTRDEDRRALEGMIKYGVKPVELLPGQRETLVRQTRRVYKEAAGKHYPQELLEEIEQHLLAYRSGRSQMPASDKGAASSGNISQAAPKKPSPLKETAQDKSAPEQKTSEPDLDFLAQVEKAYEESWAKGEKSAEIKKTIEPATSRSPDQTGRAEAWQQSALSIRNVQQALKDLGYYTARVDGIYGPLTRKAILGFQKNRGMTETGAVDNNLLETLGIH
ncbi:MAG: TRAP transporter substrate-binding protein DctP [Desulfatibacillaceae bacterium]|nr:TRAP transporter substrate-binding protein DctP [Desulfatibacillaceae bacterium]